MNDTKQIRSKWLTIRLSEAEEKKLHKFYNRTTSGSLSEYAREVLLQEPVTVLYRNQTADEFLAEMIQLKKELNAIGNNFNQAVHKLNKLDDVPEIKTWAIQNETARKIFFKKVEEISSRIANIYELWSQK